MVKKTTLRSSVIYVNFSQYDNTGRTLDYLREQFHTVLHFSFDHLRLKNGRKTNLITLYQKGRQPKRNTLYSLRVPSYLLFPSLPFVGLLMVFQTVRHAFLFRKILQHPIFFTVNAYPALIGIMLRSCGLVSHVSYWVWDYYPVKGPSMTLQIIRYAYLLFDMVSLRFSDALIFPNKRQLMLRKKLHGISGSHPIIPLGASKPVPYHTRTSHTIGFLGMLKGSQGLDLILSSFEKILKQNPTIRLEIVGSGPEELSIRNRAKQFSDNITFYGFIEDQDKLNTITRKWFAGLAVYEPVPGNESFFGDPSKIKIYLSQGVPIITTDVTEYGDKAKKNGFGITIQYKEEQLTQAVKEIHAKQFRYRKKALEFAQTLYYRNLYRKLLPHL